MDMGRPSRLEQAEGMEVPRPELRQAVAHAVLTDVDFEEQPLPGMALGAGFYELPDAKLQQLRMQRYPVCPEPELAALGDALGELARLDD